MKPKEKYFKNREKLLNYVEQSKSPELKQFVDSMLMVERCNENRPKAKLTISIGKAEYQNGEFDRFISNLSSRTNDPTVFVDSYKNEPLIAIQDGFYRDDTIFLINLTDISNLQIHKCTNSETTTYLFCTFHSKYNNQDYMIHLKVTK